MESKVGFFYSIIILYLSFPVPSCIINFCFELESNFLSPAHSLCASSKIRPKNHHPFLKTRYAPNPKNVKANLPVTHAEISYEKVLSPRNFTAYIILNEIRIFPNPFHIRLLSQNLLFLNIRILNQLSYLFLQKIS